MTEVVVIESKAFQAIKAMHEEAIKLVKELSEENFLLKQKYLTPIEVGKITGYNEKTIKIKKDEIGYITQGRDLKFKLEDVTRWMESYDVRPQLKLHSKRLDIPTKVRQYSAIKYPIYSGAKYASQTGLQHH